MFKKISKTKKIIIIFTTVIVVVGFFYFSRDKSEDYEYVLAERGDLIQEVSVTGKVKPFDKVDLAFETTGKVSKIFVNVGNKVYRGQRLASLNNSQYQAQFLQAQASFEAEQSRLDELKLGTRFEEIAVQKVKIQNANKSLVDASINLVDKIKDSYTKSDDAIRNKSDQLFNNPRSSNPELIFNTDSGLAGLVESKRITLENILNEWAGDLSSNLFNYSSKAKENLNKISSFLNQMASAVNTMNVSSTISQTTIDGYKTAISVARTNVNIAITNLSAAEEKLRTVESTLLLAKQELILKEAGATREQIKEQEAKVKSAEANMNNYSALISKTIIYSPINGIVTKRDIEIGEIIQLNTPIITVIDEMEFKIEAFIPEADIAKIKIGNKADIILDAYDENDVVFGAKIITIDPAETLVEGISTYKTILRFNEKDKRIKSGMTANIDILTDSREGVISIPYRTLYTNGKRYVKVLEGEEIVEKIIKIGIRSSDGKIEVISGLREGAKVVLK